MSIERFTSEELKAATIRGPRYAQTVRLQEVDGAGVVYFAQVMSYLNDALFSLCEQHGFPLPQMMVGDRIALPLKHAQADFLRPLRLGDRYEIGLADFRLDETEVLLGYRVEQAGQGQLVAIGQTHHVAVQLEGFSRIPVPRSFVALLSKLVPRQESAS